eukprot:TRINITY_DN87631_c0_g1_i1.p2 TRINITY_DN87631_c0_g1~~TRINITY_DN87631_c0_g1_i1.p2  ORF type:complete len:165 (-),score=19.06 TRINITY_DN87631_c0_g1_i1:73-567(-)
MVHFFVICYRLAWRDFFHVAAAATWYIFSALCCDAWRGLICSMLGYELACSLLCCTCVCCSGISIGPLLTGQGRDGEKFADWQKLVSRSDLPFAGSGGKPMKFRIRGQSGQGNSARFLDANQKALQISENMTISVLLAGAVNVMGEGSLAMCLAARLFRTARFE